jgi:hypothetical protein
MSTVEKLLWDIDLSSLPQLPPEHVPLPPPTITPENSDFGWESTARQHNLRAYLHPPQFSEKQLSMLIESQYDLAVDHLVDLHVDPPYLSEQLQLYAAHRIESCSRGPRPPQTMVNNRAAMFLLTDAIINFCVSLDVQTVKLEADDGCDSKHWHCLGEAAKRLRRAREGMTGPPVRGRMLPEAYSQALRDIQACCGAFEQKAKSRFPQILCPSPPLRSSRPQNLYV